ncbi:MAG TPA: DUF6678 family protein [Tepidisphaeraceae bacterium]|nr:DUF6678 family protein [Tepidisphaeraceae bacterium]
MTKDLAGLGSGNMNTTKWAEFFKILFDHGQADVTVQIKLLYDEKAFSFKKFWCPTRRYTEVGGMPFQNREIEWLEIRGAGAADILNKLMRLGQLPIVKRSEGFRLQAYGSISLT